MQRSPKYRAVKIWNEIPIKFRTSGYATFKIPLLTFRQQK